MSRYYKNKNQKTKYKKTNSKSVFKTILSTLLVIAVIGAIAATLRNNEQPNKNDTSTKIEYNTIYFMPSDDWSSDGSLYGAWCWSGSGLPAASFVLATDTDEDGVYELKINKEYTGLTFVDLKPDADSLGVNWDNKRAQTDDLKVPTDKNVYYHQYVNVWSNSADPIYNVTTEETAVYFERDASWGAFHTPMIYCFDKTGVTDSAFISMGNVGSTVFIGTIPAGYTHIIFLEYGDGGGENWDNVLNQTDDLVIPTGEANYYNLATNEWLVPDVE